MKPAPLLVFAAAFLAGAPASAQKLYYELVAPAGVKAYGQAVERMGDLDGDGLEDFALSAFSSRVEIRAGVDGSMLALRLNPAYGYGFTLVRVGDVDGDGTADLAVGSPGPYTNAGPCYEGCPVATPGSVEILSGRDLTPLLVLGEQDAWPDDEFGYAIAPLGDVDGDGHADFAVGAPAHQFHNYWKFQHVPGSVFAFSGADAHQLWRADGVLPSDAFGVSLAPLADRDGDGVPELAIGASGGSPGSGGDCVTLVSGATGIAFQHLQAPTLPGWTAPLYSFAASLAVVDDIDGDGVGELLCGESTAFGPAYGAVVVCQRDGHPVLPWLVGLEPAGSGVRVSAGDISGDGVPDLLLGSDAQAELAVFSGVDGARLNGLGNYADPYSINQLGRLYACAAVIGDVTGDGVADFVMGESASGGDLYSNGRVRVFAGGAFPWTPLGHALPDDRTAPRLEPVLTRAPINAFSKDARLEFRVRVPGLPTATNVVTLPGRLVLGLSQVDQPFFNGVLVPDVLFTSAFSINSFVAEKLVLALDIPPELPSGLVFYAQAVLGSADFPYGVFLTEAYRGVLP